MWCDSHAAPAHTQRTSTSLQVTARPAFLQLRQECRVLFFQVIQLGCHLLHALLRPRGHLIDDLDQSPQPQDDDERSQVLEHAVREDVDEEAAHDDEGVEAVEPLVEEAAFGDMIRQQSCLAT